MIPRALIMMGRICTEQINPIKKKQIKNKKRTKTVSGSVKTETENGLHGKMSVR